MFVNDKSFGPSGQDMDLGFGCFRFELKVATSLPPLHSFRELAMKNICIIGAYQYQFMILQHRKVCCPGKCLQKLLQCGQSR